MLSPLLYFFPGASAIPIAWTTRFSGSQWGLLPGPLAGAGHGERESGPNEATPSGGAGMFVSIGDGFIDGERLTYEPDAQEWLEVEDGAWLGIANDATPSDFYRRALAPDVRRKELLDAAMAVSTDRGAWIVPVALVDAEGCQLPTVDRYEKGAWRTAPRPAYQAIARDAMKAWQHERNEIELTRDEIRDICIRALQVNHALTAPELGIMGALFPEAYDAILGILTDRHARKKKAQSATAITCSGVKAD